jgi:hypothetical protein
MYTKIAYIIDMKIHFVFIMYMCVCHRIYLTQLSQVINYNFFILFIYIVHKNRNILIVIFVFNTNLMEPLHASLTLNPCECSRMSAL